MFKGVAFFDIYTREISSTWWLFLLQGLCLIGFGILVAFMPAILVALVSAVFIVLGVMMLVTAFRVRTLRRRYEILKREWWIEG